MTLVSALFRGDAKLEAAAVSHPAHILPGAVGAHVAKIQQALRQLDGAFIEPAELSAQRYGPSTAGAVLTFKTRRGIINRSYQTTPDNIVGIMTMAALDRELAGRVDPTVTIGRRATNPIQLGLTAGPSAGTDLRAVVRGNPYVPSGALTSDAMPDSVPPGKGYAVQVTVDPPLSDGQTLELSIINTGGGNGSATVSPATITRSTLVTVTGRTQTDEGKSGRLKIRATLDGATVKAESAGFSVCAHPLDMVATPFIDVFSNDPLDKSKVFGAGLVVKVALGSDSGNFSDLDKILMSEVVEQFRKDQPPFKDGSGFVNNSGFQGVIPPPGQTITDSHVEPMPDAGPKGVSNRIQLHIFNCLRCGAVNKVVPNSGFDILHEVLPVGRTFVHRTTKTGLAVGIRPPGMPSFKSTAGTARGCVSKAHPLK